MSTIETNPQPPVAAPDVTVVPASGQAKGAAQPTLEGFDRWIKDFQKYESILVRPLQIIFPRAILYDYIG